MMKISGGLRTHPTVYFKDKDSIRERLMRLSHFNEINCG